MQEKVEQIKFKKIQDLKSLQTLKNEWYRSLLAPQDGMWEAFTNAAQHWTVEDGKQIIGYAAVDEENGLLQFYILPYWMQEGDNIFQKFIQLNQIQKGLVGTNNPVFLSLSLDAQKSVEVHTYLFTDFLKVETLKKEGNFRSAKSGDLNKLVDFCHESMGAPVEWLKEYIFDLIRKGELFVFENSNEVLGTCEVRRSQSNNEIVDVGMIVSSAHRRKGLGTFLLGKAKEVAEQWSKKPICSCEKDNIGSLKAIQNSGFRSLHRMLLIKF